MLLSTVLRNPVSGDVLKLTITDKDTSEPVVASVTIGEETKDSGIDGVVQFTLAYGDYEATVSAEGYATVTEELAFRSNHKNFSMELEAETPATVEGITMTYDSSVSRSIAMLTENPINQTALNGILLDTGVTATIDWGDESETTTYTGPSSFTHTYESDDEFTITVTPSVADGIVGLDDWCFVAFDNSGEEPSPTDFGLTSIELPSSATSIGAYCFEGCTGLTSITLPSGVTTLGDGCFDGCTGLESITIPSTVTSIGSDSFNGCESLVDVQLYWIGNQIINYSETSFWSLVPHPTLTIPTGTTTDYTQEDYPSEHLQERT